MPEYRGADGTPLYYEDRGAGEPILVLPGGVAREPDYLADLAGIAADARMVLPHLRGTGRSPLPDEPTRIAWWEQAHDVENLRVHLGFDALTIVAHSAGTRIAIAYAVRHPERIERLVLVTPSAGYLVNEPSDASRIHDRRRGDPAYEAALNRAGEGPSGESADAFAQWQLDIGPLGYATWGSKQRAHSEAGRYNFAAIKPFFSVPPPPDLAERLAAVTAPVLVIVGAEDGMTGTAPLLALTRLFPNGRSVVIDACGHYPWVDRPTAFSEAVRPFLTRPRPR